MGLFYEIGKTLRKIFSGRNLIWHGIAIGITLIIVFSGIDWWYYGFNQNRVIRNLFFPGVMLGGVLPIFLPLGIILYGKIKQSEIVVAKGWGIGQAALLGWAVSSAYKFFTGRIPPIKYDLIGDSIGLSSFQFGLGRGGIFWGWPSSHTTVAFALAFAVVALYPKNKAIKVLVVLFAFYVGVGVATINIHWLSEFVAGAIIGTVIGKTVGKTYASHVKELKTSQE